MDPQDEQLERMRFLVEKVKAGTATDEEADMVASYLDQVDLAVESLVEASEEVGASNL